MRFPLKDRKVDLLAFLLLFLVSLFLCFLNEEPKTIMAKATLQTVFFPIQKGLKWASRPFRVYSEKQALLMELTRVSLENQLLKECGRENLRLRGLLGFKEKLGYSILPTEVVGRDPGALPTSLLIARGETSGVGVNMPCLTHEGLVGKVVQVSRETALVQTIFDPDLRVSFLDQRSRALGIVRYRGGGEFSMENVSTYSDVKVGDEVVSSGMGGVFPKGLRIGRVSWIGGGRRELFRKVSVKPAVDLSKVEEVFLLLKGEERPLLTEGIPATPEVEVHPTSGPEDSTGRVVRPLVMPPFQLKTKELKVRIVLE